MSKIGIFYGSDGGNLQDAAETLRKALGEGNADLHDVADGPVDELGNYDKFIFASSTWGDGDLQSDWEDFIDEIKNIDFAGKTVAIVGMGDQEGYEDTFCDSMSHIYNEVKAGKVVGFTSTDGYEFEESQSVVDGQFVGLALDADNQDDLTQDRIDNWVAQIKGDFGL